MKLMKKATKRNRVIALSAAIATFFLLSWFFSGTPENAEIIAAFNPLDAISGLSFSLSFALGIPVGIAIVLALISFTLLPVLVFFITLRFLHRFRFKYLKPRLGASKKWHQ